MYEGSEGDMATPRQPATGRLTVPGNDEDHVRGLARAPVTLVEYGDYQCPFCAAAHPIVQDLLSRRQDVVRLVFRHFPLTNAHPYAEVAAEIAEAAGARQRYWPMHDWLFGHQREIDHTYITSAAQEVGLLPEPIVHEVHDHIYLDRIRRDFADGVRSGVNGTPMFFINGLRHDGGYSLPELLSAVDRAAAEAV